MEDLGGVNNRDGFFIEDATRSFSSRRGAQARADDPDWARSRFEVAR